MNLENEIWKDVPNYEGMYQVSNLGRVKSLDRIIYRKDGVRLLIKGAMLNQTINTYYYVQLRKNYKSVHFAVHRLVCIAFHPNPNNYKCVNHKDENKLNNRWDNLEWCTYKYNCNYGNHKKSWLESYIPKYGRKIDVYTKYGELVNSYNSISDAVADGFNKSSINGCLSGRLDSHKGYVFKKKGEPFTYKNRSLNVFVRKYTENGEFVREYNTIRDAANDNNITKDKLSAIFRGKQPNAPIQGYKYEFYRL